jgi:hypothetical protein
MYRLALFPQQLPSRPSQRRTCAALQHQVDVALVFKRTQQPHSACEPAALVAGKPLVTSG